MPLILEEAAVGNFWQWRENIVKMKFRKDMLAFLNKKIIKQKNLIERDYLDKFRTYFYK